MTIGFNDGQCSSTSRADEGGQSLTVVLLPQDCCFLFKELYSIVDEGK